MTEQEALKVAQKMLPKAVFIKVTDYKNWFVFGVDAAKSGLMNPVAVDKANGKPMIFHPLMHDPQAYFKAVKESSHLLNQKDGYTSKIEAGRSAIEHALRLE